KSQKIPISMLCILQNVKNNFMLNSQDITNSKFYSTNSKSSKLDIQEDFKSGQLGYYLAGLIEGDGSIIVPTKDRTLSGKKTHPVIRIVFTLHDLPLAEKLQQVLGCGFIQKPKKGNYYLFEIQNYDGLLTVVNLINGKFRTPKIEALNRLINWLNTQKNSSIEYSKLDTSNLNNNSWFAGFSDADSYFQVSLTHNKELNTIKNIKSYYRLEIQQNYHGELDQYKDIMELISKFLQTKLSSRQRLINNKEYFSYMVITSSFSTNFLVDDYFKKYPMYSSKYLDYLEWSKVLHLRLNKQHLINKGALMCLDAKNNMNSKRTTWNWDHLNNFPTI
uniref:LAGLIDADG endonuclease n=1 Tax=Gongronella sp. w5 TaxID=483437 RepID=UPI0021821A27